MSMILTVIPTDVLSVTALHATLPTTRRAGLPEGIPPAA
jgi:hypothetical protein